MAPQIIKLRDITNTDDEVLELSFCHDDTILDLRKRFAEEEGYVNYQDFTFYHLINKLPDEKLVRELAHTPEGISYKILPISKVVSDADIFAICGDGKPHLLGQDEEKVIQLGHKRHFWRGGYGKFALIRNKYVHIFRIFFLICPI